MSKIDLIIVKFRLSEKGTKFEKIFHLEFDATEQRQNSNFKSKIFSNFVPFSEVQTLP